MLAPSVALTVEDRLYEEQIAGLRLSRALAPALDRLEVVLPLRTTFGAGPGATVELTLDGGDPDGGGGEARVFTGVLTGIARRADGLRLTAHDGGHALARYRPVVAFEQTGLDKVIESFCSDLGIDVRIDLDAPTLALYAAAGHATALAEIARLAALVGGAAAFDGEGVLHVTAFGGPDEELALRYGRELLSVEIADHAQPADAITIVGEGAGSPTSPQARWPAADFLSGAAPAPGPAARRRRVPELRDSADTEAAAQALAAARSAAARPVVLHTWLMPRIAPGTRLEIADLPAAFAFEDCRVTHCVSTIDAGHSAHTRIHARAAALDGGLLAALAGAVGALL